MNKEDIFINFFKNKFIGDDGAYIDGYVYSSDCFFENVHFKINWLTYFQIAQKAMLVNISDAIAMNAKAKYALINCAIPKNMTKKNLKELSNGFKKTAKKYNIKIIGGDTIENDKLDISITIISKTKNPIYRKGIEQNDLIAHTGTLGKVDKDLKKLLKDKKINKKSKFIKPKLNPKFFFKVSKYIKASIDISDGLYQELERLSKINKVGFKFTKKIAKKKACSGEEYEILFACSKTNKTKIEKIALKYNVKLNFFAYATNGVFYSSCLKHHF
jgi:thiamine-monophosphate kinase